MTDSVRITPFDLIFGGPALDASRLDLVRDQAEPAGADSPSAIAQLPAAGALLRDLLPEDEGGEAHGTVFAQVAALLFQSYRFWRGGRTIYRLDEAAFRGVVGAAEGDAEAAASLAPPREAGYVQLPRNQLWARVSEDAVPEPVDGFFWSATTARLDLLLVLGLRAARPGITVVEVTLEGGYDLAQWEHTQARPAGDDFANVLPGGELMSYHALITHAEVLKFAARCFRRFTGETADPVAEGGSRIIAVHG